LSILKDLLFPENFTCDICGKETFDANICPECLKELSFNDGITCTVCGRKTQSRGICAECKYRLPVFKRAASAIIYDGNGKKLVLKFKNGKAYLKDYFSSLLFEKLKTFPDFDAIVNTPADGRTKFLRGYDQTFLLAKELAAKTGKPFLSGAVVKTRRTKSQKFLSQNERRDNLKGSFTVKKRKAVRGKTILIVDDVLTTGATADELSRVLLAAGAKTVYLATVASVEYKLL